MDGFILVNKPKGYTSHDVCNKLKRRLKLDKIGHSGTLDPLATGLLVIGIGKATKLLSYLENQVKTYIATIKLGFETDTYDILGNIKYVNENFSVTADDIDRELSKLKETKEQIPPIYSAIKVNGKKLYNYAKENINVKIKPRPVKIDYLKRISELDNNQFLVKVTANKGFYVRTLIKDLGVNLKSFATMVDLNRTSCGNFSLEMAQDLDDVILNGPKIYTIEELFYNSSKINVSKKMAKWVLNGIILDERQYVGDDLLFVYYNDDLLAIYEKYKDNKFKPVVIIGDKNAYV